MEIPVTVENEVPEKEVELAKELRSCCSHLGVERESKIQDSATILLDMGRFYIEKAKNSSGMLQKLNFIKSAALISGARVRFEKWLSDEHKCSEAKQVFRDMSAYLLVSCKAQDSDVDLLSISEDVASLFLQFREKEKVFIEDHLFPIGDDLAESELKTSQKRKIELMKNILTENTTFYKEKMKYVSDKCIRILGDPPCRFSLVGLGSLSREEVTLYSDFEHVILLEEGIDASPNGKIREYFRWYSVIFQVIIIGLGETYISTVGVKSLNDLYSENESKSWFFDLYTPGGVSFDGRFPHSCKTPIGKQEPSKYKRHVIELIQPVDVMLKYLSIQEDKKNGYHLRDVLARTCLVHGDEDLHTDFVKRASQILTKNSRDEEVVKQAEFVLKSVSCFGARTQPGKKMNFERTKDFFYRPITLLVGCLSRVFRKTAGSSFAFLSWFRKNLDAATAKTLEGYLHDLEYAVAVAAEVRLRIYASAGHQRQKTSSREICEFVRIHCAVSCLRTILSTTVIFKECLKRKSGLKGFWNYLLIMDSTIVQEVSIKVDAHMLSELGFHEAAMSEFQRLPGQELAPALTYYKEGERNMDKREEYFRKAEDLLAKDKGNKAFKCVFITSLINYHRGYYQRSLDLIEKFDNDQCNLRSDQYIALQDLKARIAQEVMMPAEMIEYATKQIKIAREVNTRSLFLMLLSSAQLQTGVKTDINSARDNMKAAVQHFRSDIKQLHPNYSIATLQTIFELQVLKNFKDDAIETSALLEMLQDTSRKNMVFDKVFRFHKKVLGLSTVTEDKILKLEFGNNNPSLDFHRYGGFLGMLLLNHGISNFSEVSQYFSDAPLEALCQPCVYNELYDAVEKYGRRMSDARCHEIGIDLMAVFQAFEKLLCHPRFAGLFRNIVINVVTKRFDLTSAFAYAQEEEDCASLAFDQALQDYAALSMESSAKVFWTILNSMNANLDLRLKCCKLLAHIIGIFPFFILTGHLRNQRQRFLKLMYFSKRNSKTIAYNKAVENYLDCNFESSSSGFWWIILNSNRNSTLHNRAIEMLMLVILFKWECSGFTMFVGKRYISNKPKKLSQPLHANLGDFYPILFMGIEDALGAFRKKLDDRN